MLLQSAFQSAEMFAIVKCGTECSSIDTSAGSVFFPALGGTGPLPAGLRWNELDDAQTDYRVAIIFVFHNHFVSVLEP